MIKKISYIIILILILNGCENKENILKKYNVSSKNELCEKVANSSGLDLIMIAFIKNELEDTIFKNKMIEKNGIEIYKKEKENIIKEITKTKAREEINKIICTKIDNNININEYEKIMKKETMKEKVSEINKILNNKILEIIKDTQITEIKKIRELMRSEDNIYIVENKNIINEKNNNDLQFEGKILSYENKNEIVIAKVKRYDNQSIEYIKTTEEEIKKENYKISNGIEFIFSCKNRNESYLEECSMY